MERRKYLSIVSLAGVGILSGCSDSGGNGDDQSDGSDNVDESDNDDSSTSDSQNEQNEDESDDEEETEGSPTFEISATVPESVELNEEFTYTATIENTGDAPGEAQTGLDISTSESQSWEEAYSETVELDSGESRTVESDPLSFNRIYTYQWLFWIQGTQTSEKEFETEVLSATRNLNESYRNPEDIVISVNDIELKRRFTYEDFQGNEATEPASDGSQWCFVYLSVENDASQPQYIPTDFDIPIVTGNSQYDAEYIRKEDGKYEGGEVQPNVTREGWIAYEIPENLTVSDIRVIYSGSDIDGNWRAEWTA